MYIIYISYYMGQLLFLIINIKYIYILNKNIFFPLQHEKKRQLEYQKAHTLKLMLENEQRYVESLRSKLAKSKDPGTESIIQQDLVGDERRVHTLQHQLEQEVEFKYTLILIQIL